MMILWQAVNGPLQQRTQVLDPDMSSANTIPDDYDTDLESFDVRLSLGTSRNIYYQKQMVRSLHPHPLIFFSVFIFIGKDNR